METETRGQLEGNPSLQTGSLTEDKINQLGHTELGFLEMSQIIFHRVPHKGDQILGKAEMTSAKTQDGRTSALCCPITKERKEIGKKKKGREKKRKKGTNEQRRGKNWDFQVNSCHFPLKAAGQFYQLQPSNYCLQGKMYTATLRSPPTASSRPQHRYIAY